MENYEILDRIGEGAHGLVLKAKRIETGEIVALKKISLKRLDDGISCQQFRELKSLQELSHGNVIKMLEYFPHCSGFVMVMNFMPCSLHRLVQCKSVPLRLSIVKAYLKQLLCGVAYIHDNNILHRDLKPANLLLNRRGNLKIADFGLARLHFPDEKRPYSHEVATRWYRSPELLFGAKYYDEGVDLWAIGCIFGEMLNRSALFQGESDIEQIVCVFRVLGSPQDDRWPSLSELPDYAKIHFDEYDPIPLKDILPNATHDSLDLLSHWLVYNSDDRIRCSKALKHKFFTTNPLPAQTDDLKRCCMNVLKAENS